MSSQQVVDFTNKLQERSELSDLQLHRIYYYDAEPLRSKKVIPLTGGYKTGEYHDFSKTELYKANIKILDELKKQPYFAIRLGEVQFRGWSVKNQFLDSRKTRTEVKITGKDLVPNVQQKGVDMRIGLDISSLSLKNHVDVIALITGDSDFIPAMKFARREGKQIFLYTLGHSIRPEIYGHADVCIDSALADI